MTTTQAVCESMGWEIRTENNGISKLVFMTDETYLFRLEMFKPESNIVHAKMLQARLVEEGWSIHIIQYTKNNFEAYGVAIRHPGVIETGSEYQSEPEAIVTLYCKVKGIEVGNE